MPEPPTRSAPSGPGSDVVGATLSELQQAMATGALTSAALTGACLERIERLNPGLHAVITVNSRAARDAQASDEARASGAPAGPLAGIPVLVKDNIAAAGLPATAGSPALAGTESGDAFCVARLRAAGAIVLGKANLSEWANFRSTHSTSGWSTLGGQTDNPWAPGRNPSGSSSGSAAAVAAHFAPLAVGTETDGSIVCPASACGVVGIKPTVGLVSRTGIVPISLAQDTAGPIARTVADAAALLSVLAAVDPRDPAAGRADSRPGDYTAFLDPGGLAGARIGVWRDGIRAGSRRMTAVLDAALATMRAAGAHVVDPVDLPGAEEISEPEFAALLHEFKLDLNAYLAALDGDHPRSLADLIEYNQREAARVLAHFGQELFEQAAATSGDPADPDYLAARGEAARRAREALDGPFAAHRLDAVVTLTANPAWLTDYLLGDHDVFHTSSPAAVAGYPSISVPAGQVGGLPVGLSFIGPAWSEPALIGLAHAFEQLTPAAGGPSALGAAASSPAAGAVSGTASQR